MATGSEDIINEALTHGLNLDPNDADYAEWIVRGTLLLQQVVDYFWDYSDDWEFKFAATTRSLGIASGVGLTDGRVLLPADFLVFGEQGHVTLPGKKLPPLNYMAPAQLFELRDGSGRQGQYPEFYTIYGWDTATGAPYLYVEPFPQVASTLNVYYEVTRPEIIYDVPGELDKIPEQYHRTPILWGLMDLLAANGGDGRSMAQLSPRFERTLAQAKAKRKHGQEALVRAGHSGVRTYGMH